jgi:hypothetical protein
MTARLVGVGGDRFPMFSVDGSGHGGHENHAGFDDHIDCGVRSDCGVKTSVTDHIDDRERDA